MKYISYIIITSLLIFTAACSKDQSSSPGAAQSFDNASSTGQGGSLARFTIAGDHLYVVDDMKLHAYSLADGSNPVLKSSQVLGENIETIYSFKDKLFIGSQSAMYIYSISDASQPRKLGEASHVRACDPVIANDDVAYVTVRSGSSCGGTFSALIVYDIKNILQPQEVRNISMQSPWGLGMKGDRLYVCNGAAGMEIYDITKQYNPSYVKTIRDATFYDVIVYDNLLICMVDGGTLLYEIQPNGDIVKMGMIYS